MRLHNFNFAAGLINTDGHISHGKYRSIIFCNTVDSIVKAYCECLQHNNVYFRKYFYAVRKTWKSSYRVYIMRQSDVQKSFQLSDLIVQGER